MPEASVSGRALLRSQGAFCPAHASLNINSLASMTGTRVMQAASNVCLHMTWGHPLSSLLDWNSCLCKLPVPLCGSVQRTQLSVCV